MSRKEPDPPLEFDPLKGGLTHNPFAALRGKAEAAQTPAATHKSPAAGEPATAHVSAATPGPAAALVHERITVRIERTGRGGKTVTIAEGPGLARRPLEPLAREIARGMGIGARVEHATIVVQGDQRERLVVWLTERGFTGAIAGN